MDTHRQSPHAIESPYAWVRLSVSLLLMTIGTRFRERTEQAAG